MEFNDYLLELKIGTDKSLEKMLNYALEKVFAKWYLRKIERVIGERVKLSFMEMRRGVEGYNTGSNIFINIKEFKNKSTNDKIRLLLHELMHVLQRKRKLFFKSFKELDKLTNDLYKIAQENLVKGNNINTFLIGVNKEIGGGGKYEILAYLMNDRIKWNALTEKGKKLFWKRIKESMIFDLGSCFWQKRINRIK